MDGLNEFFDNAREKHKNRGDGGVDPADDMEEDYLSDLEREAMMEDEPCEDDE